MSNTAMLRSGAKKNDTGPNILKFPTLEPLKNSTSLKCATHQLESLKHFVESVIFFCFRPYKKEFVCISCCPMYLYDKIALTIILKVGKNFSRF